MATRQTINRVMIVLSAAYPRFEVKPDAVRVYGDLLADVPDSLLEAAAAHHAATSKWFPSVAELREMANEIRARAAGVRSAEEAWVNVQHAIQRFGWYGETIPPEEGGGWRLPSSLSSLERAAVDGLGGWKALCHSENGAADRAHFLRIYGGLLEREQETAQMLPVVQQAIAALAEKMDMKRITGGRSDADADTPQT